MSKAVKLDHEFDIDKYTELLIKAQGGRSQTEFANDCGLSVAYICKYINKKFDKAPIPSTIKKIAACAAGGVSYSELLEAAGYDSSKFSTDELSETPSSVIMEFEKLAMATITSALSHIDFEWSTLPRLSGFTYDFGISINGGKISNWFFEFIHESAIIVPANILPNRIMSYYGRLAMTNHEPRTKFSFVTDSVKTFENLKQFNPYMLSMFVSVILIDSSNMTVIDEVYLNSSLDLQSELENIYTVK